MYINFDAIQETISRSNWPDMLTLREPRPQQTPINSDKLQYMHASKPS